MNIVYTYFSDGIRNLDCGFCEIALFLECAKKSLRSALKQNSVDKVLIYTDDFGKNFLASRIDFGYVFNGIEERKNKLDFVIVDYSGYEYDKRFWNFPKLITYNMQENPFIHIDFDVVLNSGFLDGIDETCDIYTEKIRTIDRQKLDFLGVFDENNGIDEIICSGLLGGNEKSIELFKKNFIVALKYCNSGVHEKVTFDMLWGIEEYNFTKYAFYEKCHIFKLEKNSYVHFQGRNKIERYKDIIKKLVV
jgi:hypothetical protein